MFFCVDTKLTSQCVFFLSVLDDGDVSCDPSSPSSLQPLDAVYLSAVSFTSTELFNARRCTLRTNVDVLLLRDVRLLEFISARLDTIRHAVTAASHRRILRFLPSSAEQRLVSVAQKLSL